MKTYREHLQEANIRSLDPKNMTKDQKVQVSSDLHDQIVDAINIKEKNEKKRLKLLRKKADQSLKDLNFFTLNRILEQI